MLFSFTGGKMDLLHKLQGMSIKDILNHEATEGMKFLIGFLRISVAQCLGF